MKQILISLMLLCCIIIPATLTAEEPPGQIAVFPSMFELTIDSKPVNQSIRLKNMKNKPVTIKTDVYNWTLDQQNNLQTIPATAQSLDRWMIINPITFTIAPGQEQVVRFSIRPDVKPEPGEHRAIVYFTEQPGTKDEVAAVEVTFRIGVGIYAYTEPVRKGGQLQSLTFDRTIPMLKAEIVNNGNVHTRLKGEYAVWEKGKFPGFGSMNSTGTTASGFIASGALNNMPVLSGTRRTIVTNLALPANISGGYTIAVRGELNGQKIEKIFP